MAAVLCSSIGGLLKGCCDGLGTVATLPCRACGCACSTFSEVLTSAFFPYLALTFGLNMPGVYYGFKSLEFDCAGLSSWLLGNAVLSAVHMVAALYIVKKIRENQQLENPSLTTGDSEAQTNYYNSFTLPKENEQGAANSFTRIKHVLCYDKTMAVYIIVFVGWVIWMSMGVARRLRAPDNEACDNEMQYMNVAIICGYMYLSMVFMAFACSLCCLR